MTPEQISKQRFDKILELRAANMFLTAIIKSQDHKIKRLERKSK